MAVSAIVGADQPTAIIKPATGIAPKRRRESPIRAINFARFSIALLVCCDSRAMRPAQRGWQCAVQEVPTKRLKTAPRSPKLLITPKDPQHSARRQVRSDRAVW